MSRDQREQTHRHFRERPDVPVLILGGGINGTGLLRELALQGADCLLVDRADFAAGATSASSRMIHGGMRYLERREFALVRESLRERNLLLENAAHTVGPLKTTIPLPSRFGGLWRSILIFLGFHVRPGLRGTWPLKFGLWYYDFATRKHRKTPKHYLTGKARALRDVPGLRSDIVGAGTYWDAWIVQSERLCVELIQDALAANPTCHALNYTAARIGEGGSVVLDDAVLGESLSVRPRVVVNATGAWIDKANALLGLETRFMGGTKGSHLVVDCPPLHAALDGQIYYQHDDGRVCIVFPFLDKVIMGSTDIRVEDPDEARCDGDEVEYMLATLRGVFPKLPIGREHVVYAYCGVRPLPSSEGVTANITRGHSLRVVEPDEGRPWRVYCLIGGKLTPFRAFAELAADAILPQLGLQRRRGTAHEPIGGGRDYPADEQRRGEWIASVAGRTGLAAPRVSALLDRYGTTAEQFAADAAGEKPLLALPEYTDREIARIASREYVEHLADLVCRRSVIGLLGQAGREAVEELAEVVGAALGWDAARKKQEVAETLDAVRVPGT